MGWSEQTLNPVKMEPLWTGDGKDPEFDAKALALFEEFSANKQEEEGEGEEEVANTPHKWIPKEWLEKDFDAEEQKKEKQFQKFMVAIDNGYISVRDRMRNSALLCDN